MGDAVVRWASTGGGWRSMIACMGFGNLFHGAGLLPPLSDSTAVGPDGPLRAVATTSGSSWYSLQLFYSRRARGQAPRPHLARTFGLTRAPPHFAPCPRPLPQFYDGTVSVPPDDLRDFVYLWWDSYKDFISASTEKASFLQRTLCESLTENENERAVCKVALAYDGDWAEFVDRMLLAASTAFGDEEFHSRAADEDGRLDAVGDVDLLIQSALSPTSRSLDDENITYLGPGPTMDDLYTTTIMASYAVTSSGSSPAAGWWFGAGNDIAGEGDDGILYAASSPPPNDAFSLDEWDDFYIHPDDGGNVSISSEGRLEPGSVARPFREPFGGDTTVIQAAAASSAFLGQHSPAVPSIFAQTLSASEQGKEEDDDERRGEADEDGGDASAPSSVVARERRKAKDGRRGGGPNAEESGDDADAEDPAEDGVVQRLYDSRRLFGLAVCTRWPDACGRADSRLIDGMGADASGLAQVVGMHHSAPDADPSAPFRVLLTNTNSMWGEYDRQLVALHYSTEANRGVGPGDFLWAPAYNKQPIRSFQIFGDRMSEEQVESALEMVDGSNMTTALLSGTTVDNPAYGVRGGQRVEILLINTNAGIPTMIASPELIEDLRVPMGDMAVDIATNPTLYGRVRSFLDGTASADGVRRGR